MSDPADSSHPVRVSVAVMRAVTDANQERNIYVHPNPLARDIFWQRLDKAYGFLRKHFKPADRVLDFGGGSGAFLKGMCGFFNHVEVVDLDPQDARNLAAHLKISNVTIHQADIRTFNADPYDLVIATDVLEHFQDMNVSMEFIRRVLKPKTGRLLVSLPSENWLYRLGRVVTNKSKPLDHYHSAAEVLRFLEKSGFRIIAHRWAPSYLLPIPLFDIAVLEQAG